MAREMSAASLKALEKEVLNMSEELGKLTRAYFAGLVATGIVAPRPPRPHVGIVGRLTYGLTLIQEASVLMRRLRR
jgi:hypothetical protein